MIRKYFFLILCFFVLFPLFSQELDETGVPEITAVNSGTAEMVDWMEKNLGELLPLWRHSFLQVDRKLYLPLNRRSLSYQPGEILLDDRELRFSPLLLYRIFQRLNLQEGDKLLVAGNYGAYEARLLKEATMDSYLIYQKEEIFQELDLPVIQGGYPYVQWLSEAPFQGILLTSPQENIAPELLNQLEEGALLIAQLQIPGGWNQWVIVEKIGFSYKIELWNSLEQDLEN